MSRDGYRKEYTTLGIGMGGVYATAPNQWADTYASITIPDRRLVPYYGDLVEGGVVIDKRPCENRDDSSESLGDFIRKVISGPMLAEFLPEGHYEPWTFPRSQPIKWEGQKLGSCDYIALDIYLGIWRDMGARIGKRGGETIVWEDGEVEAIPSESERWMVNGKIRDK